MKVDLKETRHEDAEWIQLAKTGVQWWDPVNMVTNIWGYTEGRECLEKPSDYQLLMNSLHSLVPDIFPSDNADTTIYLKKCVLGPVAYQMGSSGGNF